MTPLIDIVFLLLTFFVVSFKIVSQEGDFGIKIPQTGGAMATVAPTILPMEPIRVRLFADANGHLADIQIGSLNLGPDPHKLREQIIKQVGTAPTPKERENWEAIIDYDRHLKYQYTMDALTAISGYMSGGTTVPLIDKINFAEK